MDIIVLAKEALLNNESLTCDQIRRMIHEHPELDLVLQQDHIALLICCLENVYASFRLSKKRRVPRFINGVQAGWQDGIIDETYNPLDQKIISDIRMYLIILSFFSIYNDGIDFSRIDQSMPLNYYSRIICDLNPYIEFIFTGVWNDANLQKIFNFDSFQ